jgi:hypothetical protein
MYVDVGYPSNTASLAKVHLLPLWLTVLLTFHFCLPLVDTAGPGCSDAFGSVRNDSDKTSDLFDLLLSDGEKKVCAYLAGSNLP